MQSSDAILMRLVDVIVNPIIRLMFIGALVYFLFGMVQFIRNADEDKARTTGKQHMLWGVVGMAIMIGVYTIMSISLGTLNTLAK